MKRSVPFILPCRTLVVLATACVCLLRLANAQIDTPDRTPIPPGPYRIAGTVVNSKGGGPLARARVTVADVKNRQNLLSVITGDNGHFEFRVPAGKYSLDGAKRGFIEASFNQHDQYSTAIVTGANFDTENLAFRLAPNAVLAGKVLDEFQEPVRQAQVIVYRENRFQGVSRIIRFSSALTDDQGRYEVTPLNEGTYFVSAKASPWYAIHPSPNGDSAAPPSQVDSSLDVVYPLTYYGDTTETEDAIPIPVRGGDHLEADIHLTPVPSLHLVVHVPENSGHSLTFPVLEKPTFDGMEQIESGNIQMVSPGLFELSGVAAGRYTVRLPDPAGARESTEVDLVNGGELDVSSGTEVSKIKMTVQVAGASSPPPQLYIGMRNNKGTATAVLVDEKGEADFADVSPGKYDLVAGSRIRAYSVARITTEAGTVPGHTLNVPPGAALNISVALVGGSVTIEGFAKRNGKAVAGAMIVLVPKDPEADHDSFRRDQSDLDGSFALQWVLPGAYTVIAIDDGWDLNWSQPAVLARYLAHGRVVEAGDRSPSPIHLPDAVEVQAK